MKEKDRFSTIKRRVRIGVAGMVVVAGAGGCAILRGEPTVPEPRPVVIVGDGYVLEQGEIGSNRITVYTRKDNEKVFMEKGLGVLRESQCDVIRKFPRGSAKGKDGQYAVADLFVIPNNTCMSTKSTNKNNHPN